MSEIEAIRWCQDHHCVVTFRTSEVSIKLFVSESNIKSSVGPTFLDAVMRMKEKI